MTEWETNRVKRPSRKTPAAIWRPPARTSSSASAPVRASPVRPESASPAASAAALVVETTMSWVRAVRPPAIAPTIAA